MRGVATNADAANPLPQPYPLDAQREGVANGIRRVLPVITSSWYYAPRNFVTPNCSWCGASSDSATRSEKKRDTHVECPSS